MLFPVHVIRREIVTNTPVYYFYFKKSYFIFYLLYKLKPRVYNDLLKKPRKTGDIKKKKEEEEEVLKRDRK